MGHGSSSTQTSKTSSFKLFEYRCTSCSSRRPVQYFYRNNTFLPQAPRVVCGDCNTSVVVEPYKQVDYNCPHCRKWHKVRLPAKPMPLNMYNVSVVSCNCGFRGEASMGRLMDVVCATCWSHKRELRSVWTEDGDEIKTYCDCCQDYRRSFVRAPQKKAVEATADLEYTCDNCFRDRPIHAEELLRNQGLANCSLCGWVGHPEVFPRGCKGSGATSLGNAGGPAHQAHHQDSGGASSFQDLEAPSRGSKGRWAADGDLGLTPKAVMVS